ncbi:MAG: hypothetical protein HOG18_06220 [Proteobacteria bacterium]|jgi:hypothetical protein|nr:hypothetical protein [Pseudomonadota bacterium]MDB4825299.1 hypothetical protein [Gammaproteobacteria bacterium]MBT4107959.1 hypothetical protein [Pseudomonadota bacterium]MBT4356241.1 hypothetical protein [Pseudomonadota bacterium]MBT4986642.1 hypothetical protein [Pseudomonadota bacterium]|tara:strand:- start:213 stop:473 length:261 start_codon:yes stop_codon:yes gene_type:complete
MIQFSKKINAVTTLAGFLILSCAPAEGDESYRNTPITELTVGDLEHIIQKIVDETLEGCVVQGKVEGKSTLSLKVFADVEAKINCP